MRLYLLVSAFHQAFSDKNQCGANLQRVTLFLNESETTDRNSGMHPTTSFTIKPPTDDPDGPPFNPVATATFCDVVDKVGQARLVIQSVANDAATDADYFYSFGFAEGYLTAKRIIQQVFNVVWSQPKQTPRVYDFLITQYNFMRENAREKSSSDSFWFQVGLALARLDGMTDGIKARQQEAAESFHNHGKLGRDQDESIWPFYLLTYMDLYGLNSVSELGEIVGSFAKYGEHVFTGRYTDTENTEAGISNNSMYEEEEDLRLNEYELAEKSKCSALVKLVHAEDRDLIDLVASHNTWTSYGEMLRIYKTMVFEHVSHHSFANKRISMASYPGYLSSTDDWITLPDSNLLITETTNECISKRRLRRYVVPDSVTTNVRSLVASLMASSGSEWFDWFSRENSGTYNNQWILVDFGRFNEWKQSGSNHVPSDVLWIGEQAPGLIISKDMSDHLFETTYWASYNRPYFAEIANVSGYTAASKLKGEWFHHQKCPRARMFAALHSAVEDVESMQSIMTLNRWDRMNASYLHTHNCPKNQIAGRYDIDPHLRMNSEDYKKCGPVMAYGALDCKVINTEMMIKDEILIMSAPAWNNSVPAFNWSQVPGFAQVAHWGHPEVWNFGFVKWKKSEINWSDGGLIDQSIQLPEYVLGDGGLAIRLPEHSDRYV
jgi:hypothetical protein